MSVRTAQVVESDPPAIFLGRAPVARSVASSRTPNTHRQRSVAPDFRRYLFEDVRTAWYPDSDWFGCVVGDRERAREGGKRADGA